MTERTVRVNGKDIFVADTGTGPPVVLLHGGGPGASGMSNYSRNIEPLAQHFRVIVPDMPGYGRSAKGVDGSDPFGYLADHIRGMLDVLGIDRAHLVGNSYGGSCALRLALDTPHRVDKLVLMGPGGVGTTRGLPTAGLKSLLGYYGGDGPSLDKLRTFIRTYLVYDGDTVPESLIQTRYESSIDPEVVANPPLQRPSGLRTLWRMDFTRDRTACQAGDADTGDLGARRQGQQAKRRSDAGAADAQRRRPADCQYRPLGPVGTGGLLQRGHHRIPERLIANVHRHHPLGVRQRPPGLCRHRNRQVRRLETLRPRGNRDAPRRHGTRHGPIPPRRQRMPRAAAARAGRGRRRAGLAPRRPCHLRRDLSPRRRPRGAHRRGRRRGSQAARRRALPAVPRAQRADPGDLHHRPHRTPAPGHHPAADSSPAQADSATSRSPRKNPTSCVATTTTSTTRGCPTTSTRPSTA